MSKFKSDVSSECFSIREEKEKLPVMIKGKTFTVKQVLYLIHNQIDPGMKKVRPEDYPILMTCKDDHCHNPKHMVLDRKSEPKVGFSSEDFDPNECCTFKGSTTGIPIETINGIDYDARRI